MDDWIGTSPVSSQNVEGQYYIRTFMTFQHSMPSTRAGFKSQLRETFGMSDCYLFIGACNFHYGESHEPQKTIFFIVRTESMHTYVCRVYHQLLQYIAKLRQITIDLCKSRLVTIETPRNHSLTQHQIVFAIVEKYIGIVTNIGFKSHQM